MAFYTTRVNLGFSSFPLLTNLAGRTIIVPGQDQHYDRAVVQTTADTEKDKGIPQGFFLENVMPTSQGVQSIGYSSLLDSLSGATDFSVTFPAQVTDEARILLCPAGGKNYILDKTVSDDWNTNSSFAAGTVPANVQVTMATVNGITYFCYKKYRTYKYNTTTKLLEYVPLVGIIEADVVAICESAGQFIAITDTGVAWSSLTDPTDFTPSVVTGAGGGNLQEAVGRLIACFTMSGGFIIYCEGNMVSARVTGNTNSPFMFTQVPGSGGILTANQVSWQSSIADQFAWTTVGLQQVSSGSVKNLLPEIVDFVAGKQLEVFNSTDNSFSTVNLDTPLTIAIHVIGLRYIVISYSTNGVDYDYALVYDLFLKRYGKLRITHRDCIEWNYPSNYDAITYDDLSSTSYDDLSLTTYDDLLDGIIEAPKVKETFAFIQADGSIKKVNFAWDEDTSDGVLLMGKYQFVRNLMITHQRNEWETIGENIPDFQSLLLITLDGKTFNPAQVTFAMPRRAGARIRAYQKVIKGANFSILLKGSFNLVSGLVRFSLGGVNQG